MKAQTLYDLRHLTGYCSSSDLHEFFRNAVGDPSPSGKMEIDEKQIQNEAFQLMEDPNLASIMREYSVSEEAIFQYNSTIALGEDKANALHLAVKRDEIS